MTLVRHRPYWWIALTLVLAGETHAVEVQTWTQQTSVEFEEGQLDRVVATSDNRVELSRKIEALTDLDVAHVWGLARQADGQILAATGGPGLVLRIAEDGKIAKLHESKDQQIFSIAMGADGSIFYASSPSGEIFKISPTGDVGVFFETEETYVWSLAVGVDGAVYAATGPHGKLFRILPDGTGEVFFKAGQKHLLSLALGPAHVYVGTSTDGIIYRLDAEGKPFVLHDSTQADVHALVLDQQGRLYAGTGTPERPNFPATSQWLPMPPTRWRPSALALAWGLAAYQGAPLAPVADAPSAPAPAPKRAPLRSGSAGLGENSVYGVGVDGNVDEIFREKCLILSLAMQEDRILVGTGQEGRLFLIDSVRKTRQTLARLPSGQIQAMAAEPAGSSVLGTGVPGQLWRVSNRFSDRGLFASNVFDAKLQARWGKGQVRAEIPAGTRLAVEYRAGNVEEPDETWSAWSADAATLPLSRFLQYRATLESADGRSTPSLASVSVYFGTINRPPVVESLDVPDLVGKPIIDSAGKLAIRWKGSDPNGDTLVYDVEIRKEGWPDWVAVARELTASELSWEPGSLPSGIYRLRVIASDAPSNRQEEKLTGSATSAGFVLDRDAPIVTISSAEAKEGKIEVAVSAKDGDTRLTSAAYSLDGRDWWPIFPDDGLFDSMEEAITFHTGPMSPANYIVLVRFRDSAGHWGIADTVTTVPAPAGQ